MPITRQALRTGTIEIDTSKINDVQWIVATIQNLEIDESGKIISEQVRDDKVYRRIDRVALETITITDPVTGVESTLSVAGVGTAIKALMIKWLLEDNEGATYDSAIGMVIK